VVVVFLALVVAATTTPTTVTPATTPGAPFYEQVPIRIHGHDTSWPPVLIAAVLVVVFGGLFLAVVFLRNVRATLRAERRND
jgi:hypothetical protein